jgi:hypothetical protein
MKQKKTFHLTAVKVALWHLEHEGWKINKRCRDEWKSRNLTENEFV